MQGQRFSSEERAAGELCDSVDVTAADKAAIRRLHANVRAHLATHNAATAGFLAAAGGAWWTWSHGWWPLTIALWAVAGHLGHSKLIAFHEASHGTLNAHRWLNELQGILIGSLALVPLSVYRYVHGQHHAYIATRRDLEMWPFVKADTPRAARILAVVGELVFGFFYTPFLFLHGVIVGDNIPRRQRRRIVAEYAICIVVWVGLLAAYWAWDAWELFLVAQLVPQVIAGNPQSLRKFTEHMGLVGDTILTTTRTVVDRRLVGRTLSESMLHIDYHGTHHRYAKVPYYNLPAATPYVYGEGLPTVPIFTSYMAAMFDMFRSLGDPKVGSDWMSDRRQAKSGKSAPRKRLTSILRTDPGEARPVGPGTHRRQAPRDGTDVAN